MKTVKEFTGHVNLTDSAFRMRKAALLLDLDDSFREQVDWRYTGKQVYGKTELKVAKGVTRGSVPGQSQHSTAHLCSASRVLGQSGHHFSQGTSVIQVSQQRKATLLPRQLG